MLNNLKLIFVHGVNEQVTNYSHILYQNIIEICRADLKRRGHKDTDIEKIVQHEVLWADLTTDLTNRYQQLTTSEKKFSALWVILLSIFPLWSLPLFMRIAFIRDKLTPWLRQKLIAGIDPLAIQIMHYVKDKGDKSKGNGDMNILKDFDKHIKRIFSKSNEDVGYDPVSREGKNCIIVAHSLGSVIAMDYVMRFRKDCALDPDIKVKGFITLGSPIPLFDSAMGHPDSDLELPTNVKRWVNIINPLDGIARPITNFFRKVSIDEKTVSFGYDPIGAHTGYWNDPKTAKIIAEEVLAALG